MYYYRCEKCGVELRRICSPQESKIEKTCDCGGKFVRAPSGVSSTAMETLDNGIMARSVTRYSDAEELYKNLDSRNKES